LELSPGALGPDITAGMHQAPNQVFVLGTVHVVMCVDGGAVSSVDLDTKWRGTQVLG